MGQAVCMGATLQCSFGAAPSTLVVLPTGRVMTGTPTASIMDFKPMVNIPPFGMCRMPDYSITWPNRRIVLLSRLWMLREI